MYKFTFLFLLFLFHACHPAKVLSEADSLKMLNANLNDALAQQDVDAFLSIVSKPHQDEQIAFLGGNTKQFCNEFFCGNYRGKYTCPGFKNIVSIAFLEKKEALSTRDGFRMSFLMTTDKGVKITGETMIVKEDGEYRLMGAVG